MKEKLISTATLRTNVNVFHKQVLLPDGFATCYSWIFLIRKLILNR